MRITVRFLGYLRVEFGHKETMLEVPDGSCLCDAMALLMEQLGPAPRKGLVARGGKGYNVLLSLNGHTADTAATLRDGDDLTLFPPSAGGG